MFSWFLISVKFLCCSLIVLNSSSSSTSILACSRVFPQSTDNMGLTSFSKIKSSLSSINVLASHPFLIGIVKAGGLNLNSIWDLQVSQSWTQSNIQSHNEVLDQSTLPRIDQFRCRCFVFLEELQVSLRLWWRNLQLLVLSITARDINNGNMTYLSWLVLHRPFLFPCLTCALEKRIWVSSSRNDHRSMSASSCHSFVVHYVCREIGFASKCEVDLLTLFNHMGL